MATKEEQLSLFAGEAQSPTPPAATAAPAPPAQPDVLDPGMQEFDAMVKTAAGELRSAKGDRRMERAALCRYFKRGTMAGYGMELLVDVLGVSSNVLDAAGYSDEENQALMDTLGEISDAEIATTPLD